jgi:hypothetical protein
VETEKKKWNKFSIGSSWTENQFFQPTTIQLLVSHRRSGNEVFPNKSEGFVVTV